jgi:hypothetical protein
MSAARELHATGDAKAVRDCRSCGCPLFMVTGPNGKTIPLDRRAPVYTVERDLAGGFVAQKAEAFVTHFCTCPTADKHTRSRQR